MTVPSCTASSEKRREELCIVHRRAASPALHCTDALPPGGRGAGPLRRLTARHGPANARARRSAHPGHGIRGEPRRLEPDRRDRKSTRLNSSHMSISYAVFCLKKKIKNPFWRAFFEQNKQQHCQKKR